MTDIEREIAHIKRNGISLAKFGGQEADEGRCRELCAMYLREFILSYRMGQRLKALDLAAESPPTHRDFDRLHSDYYLHDVQLCGRARMVY